MDYNQTALLADEATRVVPRSSEYPMEDIPRCHSFFWDPPARTDVGYRLARRLDYTVDLASRLLLEMAVEGATHG